jgi:hypothetical protein
MAAGVSVDRFEREIHLPAKLQPPPYRAAPHRGVGGGPAVLYHAAHRGRVAARRLAHDHERPVGETVPILRDVADASFSTQLAATFLRGSSALWT